MAPRNGWIDRPVPLLVAGFALASGPGPGCAPGPGLDGDRPPDPPPAYAELAAGHNSRIERLRQVHATGVIEQDGRHQEQCRAQLWLQLPHKTALRMEKLGEVLLWLGSDEQRYWFFDGLNREETVLYVGDHDAVRLAPDRAGLATNPFALLDLMALVPLPAARGPGDPAVAYDADHDAWRVQAPGLGGPMRVFFDRSTRLPKRVEALSEDGAVVATSDLPRYESVEQRGVAPLARPKFPTKVDISLPPGDDRVMLAVEGPRSTTNARVFELDRLIRALRPDRVEGR
ncbi:MAG: hypothetical protein ACYSXF_11735 [Planctomycetota bacterium]|jgi:hypothetical protein